MSDNVQERNKEIVSRWFDAVWGKNYDPAVIDELASPEIVMQYPLHGRNEGLEAVGRMLDRLRVAFPNLAFSTVGDIIAEGNHVVGRWEGGGTHTGPAFSDLPAGALPENSGKRLHFSGMTVFTVVDGKIVEELGEEDALKAGLQLGVIREA